MKTMTTRSFKVHYLAVVDEVQPKKETVVITKRGKPVASDSHDLTGCGKMFGDVSFRASARNLALKLKEIRDSSSPLAPRNDRLDGFFRSLLKWRVPDRG